MAFILKMFQRLALILVMMCSAYPVLAAVAGTPEAFVEGLVRNALSDLRGQLPAPELKRRFAALIAQNFDLPFISRFTLGRYWDSATETERSDFQKLFAEFLVQAHANNFNEFAGQTIRVTGSMRDGGTITVMSQLFEGGSSVPKVGLNWVLHDANPAQGGPLFRIVDVVVIEVGEGRMSLADWHRDEVRAVIHHRQISRLRDLNEMIRMRLRSLD